MKMNLQALLIAGLFFLATTVTAVVLIIGMILITSNGSFLVMSRSILWSIFLAPISVLLVLPLSEKIAPIDTQRTVMGALVLYSIPLLYLFTTSLI